MEYTNEAVAVAQTGNTEIARIPTFGLSRIFLTFTVTVSPLDAFIIKAKANTVAPEVTLYSAGNDYLTPKGLIVGASGDLTIQPNNSTGLIVLDVLGLYEVVIYASSALTASSVVSVFAGGS